MSEFWPKVFPEWEGKGLQGGGFVLFAFLPSSYLKGRLSRGTAAILWPWGWERRKRSWFFDSFEQLYQFLFYEMNEWINKEAPYLFELLFIKFSVIWSLMHFYKWDKNRTSWVVVRTKRDNMCAVPGSWPGTQHASVNSGLYGVAAEEG